MHLFVKTILLAVFLTTNLIASPNVPPTRPEPQLAYIDKTSDNPEGDLSQPYASNALYDTEVFSRVEAFYDKFLKLFIAIISVGFGILGVIVAFGTILLPLLHERQGRSLFAREMELYKEELRIKVTKQIETALKSAMDELRKDIKDKNKSIVGNQ